MKVPGRPRRLQLDFVRGVAILMVMLGHFRKPQTGFWILDRLNDLSELFGNRGVDLFFVLSGFLVGGLLLREYGETGKIQAGRFLVRRIFKIWPAYYVLIFFHVAAHRHDIQTFFWQNLLQLQNYLGSSIKQTWTLSIEEHFYLLFALMLAFAASRKWSAAGILKLFATVGLISCIARAITVAFGNYNGAARWTQNRLDSLFFGAILALLYHLMPNVYLKITARAWPLIAVTVFGSVWVFVAPDPASFLGLGFAVIYIAAGAFLLLVQEHSGRLTKWWIYRVISWIGIYSYALYLWHSVMLEAGEEIIARYPAAISWELALVVQFLGAIAVAYVTTRLIEWPFLQWRESIAWLRDSKPLGPCPDHAMMAGKASAEFAGS